MKIIHTSDWHIGKIVNEYSMIDDQKYILNKLIELIDEENADVLMIAGDVYDRSIPPVEAVELLNETLSSLVIDRNVSVLVISGNHDSGAVWSSLEDQDGLLPGRQSDRRFESDGNTHKVELGSRYRIFGFCQILGLRYTRSCLPGSCVSEYGQETPVLHCRSFQGRRY